MRTQPTSYLSVEMPYTAAIVDFLGDHPFTVQLRLDKGKLHISAVSATQDAPILLDDVVDVPARDKYDDEDED